MRRRTALRAAGAALAATGLPATLASETSADGQEDEPFTPRSHLSLPGTKEAVVGRDGPTVYAAVTDGFATVDVSDPDDPRVLAERRGLLSDHEEGPMEEVHDVALDGDVLAVAGPAHGGTPSGVLVYDVSNPADPSRIAFHETENGVHNCDVADGAVYATSNNRRDNPVVVATWEDGETREVSRWSLFDVDRDAWSEVHLGARVVHDVTVVDGVAYLAYWDAGTWLLDVSEPSDPTLLGSVGGRSPEELASLTDAEKGFATLEPPGNAHYAEIGDDGTVLAVGKESWDGRSGDGHGGPSGIDLWDVSDPENGERLATIEPVVPRDATRDGIWTTAHNFELTGGRLYSSWYQDGVRIHDVSDPAEPELLAHWRDPDESRFWTARLGRPGEFFVAADMGTRDGGTDGAGIYCFPDRAGTQPDQPTIPTATPTPSGSTISTRSPTDSPTASATQNGTHETPGTTDGTTPARTPTGTATGPTGGTDGPGQSVQTPGFGLLAGAGGLGLAAWRNLRRRE